MTSREEPEVTRNAALDAYRDAARAEADSYFDDRALDAQRRRILARLEQAGTRAKVLAFPGAIASMSPAVRSPRRWISAAAAAGLLIGLITGQLLQIMPGDNWSPRTPTRLGPPPASRMAIVPALATTTMEADDALLDAIDLAVARRGASDLRAFDDFTFASEPD